jgi:hypothetical protein
VEFKTKIDFEHLEGEEITKQKGKPLGKILIRDTKSHMDVT